MERRLPERRETRGVSPLRRPKPGERDAAAAESRCCALAASACERFLSALTRNWFDCRRLSASGASRAEPREFDGRGLPPRPVPAAGMDARRTRSKLPPPLALPSLPRVRSRRPFSRAVELPCCSWCRALSTL